MVILARQNHVLVILMLYVSTIHVHVLPGTMISLLKSLMSVVNITYYIINDVNMLLYLDTCILPPVTGSCTRSVTRWYFNHVLGKCQSFIYSGCDGIVIILNLLKSVFKLVVSYKIIYNFLKYF